MPEPLPRKQHLERLIQGLKQSIETSKFEMPYYTDGDLQGRYAKVFLVATEGELVKAEKELAELQKNDPPAEEKKSAESKPA